MGSGDTAREIGQSRPGRFGRGAGDTEETRVDGASVLLAVVYVEPPVEGGDHAALDLVAGLADRPPQAAQ
ncbi:hypothetical protein [Halorubrum sp. SD612]|uniref:hypothetical protein n=1 Tax=Halorubrum sp. SD612 TaxID=1855863 RepID=UPI000A2DA216|nr:hypothetical protein [Halorubrum sp. SD612]OTF10591.1 hypothetical protein B9G38_05475 [Halorubrum sp. SD612]